MTTTYSKSDLIADLASSTGESKNHAEKMVGAVLDLIASRAAERKVSLKGFGSFETRERAERNGRNPATGEAIRLPASSRLTFKPSRSSAS